MCRVEEDKEVRVEIKKDVDSEYPKLPRKFRKMGQIMTVVNIEDRVLFGVSLRGRFCVPMPVPEKPYKYETLRKRLSEGKSWWGVE